MSILLAYLITAAAMAWGGFVLLERKMPDHGSGTNAVSAALIASVWPLVGVVMAVSLSWRALTRLR